MKDGIFTTLARHVIGADSANRPALSPFSSFMPEAMNTDTADNTQGQITSPFDDNIGKSKTAMRESKIDDHPGRVPPSQSPIFHGKEKDHPPRIIDAEELADRDIGKNLQRKEKTIPEVSNNGPKFRQYTRNDIVADGIDTGNKDLFPAPPFQEQRDVRVPQSEPLRREKSANGDSLPDKPADYPKSSDKKESRYENPPDFRPLVPAPTETSGRYGREYAGYTGIIEDIVPDTETQMVPMLPQPHPATPSRPWSSDTEEATDSSPVRITIGRLEIRAEAPPGGSQSETAYRLSKPRLTLAEYLNRRTRSHK